MSEYPKDFMDAVTDLIDNWEGGYVLDLDDPGGETKFGISKRAYPALDIAHLTRDQAVAIYFRDYWQKYHLDTIPDPQMRAKVFNMGVLMGTKTALMLMAACKNISEYRLACKRHFDAICIKHPQCNRFLRGWTRRALA
jgi:lysozyme family protein